MQRAIPHYLRPKIAELLTLLNWRHGRGEILFIDWGARQLQRQSPSCRPEWRKFRVQGWTVKFGLHQLTIPPRHRRPQVDFSYRRQRDHVVVYPETPQAVVFWNAQLAPATHGTGHVAAAAFPRLARQLREAGYVVRVAPPVRETNTELLQSLGAQP